MSKSTLIGRGMPGPGWQLPTRRSSGHTFAISIPGKLRGYISSSSATMQAWCAAPMPLHMSGYSSCSAPVHGEHDDCLCHNSWLSCPRDSAAQTLLCLQTATYTFVFPDKDQVYQRVMIPLLDLVNHYGIGSNTFVTKDPTTLAYHMVATKDIK